MNRWHRIHRLRGPILIILVGVLALLNQWDVLHWQRSWPLFLIVIGLLLLAERVAWTADARELQVSQDIGLPAEQSGDPTAPFGSSVASYPSSDSYNSGDRPSVHDRPPALNIGSEEK